MNSIYQNIIASKAKNEKLLAVLIDPDKMKLEDQANDDPPLARWAKIMSLGHQDFHSRETPITYPVTAPVTAPWLKAAKKWA